MKFFSKEMAETGEKRKIFSLIQVTRSIQATIRKRYGSAFWVQAELNKLNYYKHSGHCYPELVQKKNGRIITQMRSILWKTDYIRINKAFKEIVHEPLKDGIKILFLAKVNFDPQYGLSLTILDIDPGFTLGDLEKEKQETLKKLKTEGILHLNKEKILPVLPSRIAVISVETSKGYADFLNVFEEAEQKWKYKIFHMLFPSLLQGDNAVQSILNQLNRIRKVIHHFDLVVIVRGGGGDIGLSCYNNYFLAKAIALFPIPVITGIGHATNETAVEIVAHTNAITPTKLAEIIVQKYHDFALPVEEARQLIIQQATSLIAQEKENLQSQTRHFRAGTRYLLSENRNFLKEITRALEWNFLSKFKQEQERLKDNSSAINLKTKALLELKKQDLSISAAKIQINTKQQLHQQELLLNYQSQNLNQQSFRFAENRKNQLMSFQKSIKLLDPRNVLKRGYSISMINGELLKNSLEVNVGDRLKTILFEGELISEVKETKKIKNDDRKN